MTEEIKQMYKFFNLDFDASVEDVKGRQKSMIKVERAKAIKRGVSNKKKINQIALMGEELVHFIETNGVQEKEKVTFDTKLSDVITELSLAFIAFIVCVISFISLL